MKHFSRFQTYLFFSLFFFIAPLAAKAQSYDTLVLRNVEKKYLIGKVLSIQSDYVVYFRQNLPNGPEFRMNKQNVKWIITSSNEIIEVSETYDPAYNIKDSTSIRQPTLNQQNKASTSTPESTQEYYTRPSQRTIIPEQQTQSNRVTVLQEKNRYKAPLKNDFFTVTFMIGASTQRFQNFQGVAVAPGVSAGVELGYIGFRDKMYINPSVRLLFKNVRLNYSTIDSGTNLSIKEFQSFIYSDFSLTAGYVLSENNGNRSVFFIGPYLGAFIGGSYRAEIEGFLAGFGSVNTEVEGGLMPGEWDPNIPSQTQYFRPFEAGIFTGLRFQAGPRVMLGPDIKYGLTNIFPKLRNVGGVAGSLPQIRSATIHFSICLLY